MSGPVDAAGFKKVTEANYKRVLAEFYTVAYNVAAVKTANPSLSDLKLLDLGCGNGELCAEFLTRGAQKVVGIDISRDMLSNCTPSEKAHFHHGSIFELQEMRTILSEDLGTFDGVSAVWSSSFASSVEALQALFHLVKASLRPNGTFVMIVSNPAIIWDTQEVIANADLKNYSVQCIQEEPAFSKMNVCFRDLTTGEPLVDFTSNCFKIETVLECFRTAGLTSVRHGALDIDPNSPNLGYELERFRNYVDQKGSTMCFIAQNS